MNDLKFVFQMILDISDGNRLEIFMLQQLDEWSAEVRSLKSLKGKHGNYTLMIRAQDLGTPSHLIEASLHICIIDFNDHAPLFITPPHNSTLRVPEVNQNYNFLLKQGSRSVFFRMLLLEVLWYR